jgi:transposase
MAKLIVISPSCGLRNPSARVELVAPGQLPAEWERWPSTMQHTTLRQRQPGQRYLLFRGLASDNGYGDPIVKRRWVVERTSDWLMLHRRLARDYEKHPGSSRAIIYLVMIDNTAKRITGETTPIWRNTPQDHQAVMSTLLMPS